MTPNNAYIREQVARVMDEVIIAALFNSAIIPPAAQRQRLLPNLGVGTRSALRARWDQDQLPSHVRALLALARGSAFHYSAHSVYQYCRFYPRPRLPNHTFVVIASTAAFVWHQVGAHRVMTTRGSCGKTACRIR